MPEFSIQLLVTCLAVGIAVALYDAGKRRRNAFLASAAAGGGALFENAVRGDLIRAAFFVPVCFLLGWGGTLAANAILGRRGPT